MIDYEDLLRRFMEHVVECEGLYFLDHLNRTGVKFTDEEVKLLRKLVE